MSYEIVVKNAKKTKTKTKTKKQKNKTKQKQNKNKLKPVKTFNSSYKRGVKGSSCAL